MVFSCKPYKVQTRVIDTSLLATRYSLLPQSLGLRPQTLKMRLISPNIKGHFLKQQIQFQDIFSRVEGQKSKITKPHMKASIHRKFIGETVSLICAPYICRNNMLYDAVVERPVRELHCDRIEETFEFDHNEALQVKFVPTLCPHCGWDLKGEKKSCVLFCTNCDSAWEATGTGFKKLDYGVVGVQDREVLYVPFWKMKVAIEGALLQSYADLIRFTNLPKVVKRGWDEKELFFWSPAFKIQPRLFLRLAKQVTIIQPDAKLENSLNGLSLFPVMLPAAEAVESVTVILAQTAADKKKFYPKLADIKVSMCEHSIIFLPFFIRANDLIQCQMKFSLNRNALKLGKKI